MDDFDNMPTVVASSEWLLYEEDQKTHRWHGLAVYMPHADAAGSFEAVEANAWSDHQDSATLQALETLTETLRTLRTKKPSSDELEG